MKKTDQEITVHALRAVQGGVTTYTFYLYGPQLLQVAEISRISQKKDGSIQGFQRKEIKKHVASIANFLKNGPVLFPNAIILAFSQKVKFTQVRGTKVAGLIDSSTSGRITLPINADGNKPAWIVDGQQRSIALSRGDSDMQPVPVVAFVSDDINVQREQFILVNKAKPLSPRLVDELLPEMAVVVASDLAPRKIPSKLCSLLNTTKGSPFYGLIKRTSNEEDGIVQDSHLVAGIKRSIEATLGGLAAYKATGIRKADIDSMYRTLVNYWSAVKEVFPEAWGRPPEESRLMHGAGIYAMSGFMDLLVTIIGDGPNQRADMKAALRRIAPQCAWTKGKWPDIQRDWNDLQVVSRDKKMLSDQLVLLHKQNRLARVA